MPYYFMLGLSTDGDKYGAYNSHDEGLILNVPGRAAKNEKVIAEAARRLESMGLGGYLNFLWRKAAFTWQDGTFYYGKEGRFVEVYLLSDPISVAMQTLTHPNAEGSALYRAYGDGLWLAVLLLMALSSLKKNQPPLLHASRLTLLGLILFLLLFEARSRYILNHLPLFALMGAAGLDLLCEKAAAIRIKE